MKTGDKVKFISPRDGKCDSVVYSVLETGDTWIKVKHPDIRGYFIFRKDLAREVIGN